MRDTMRRISESIAALPGKIKETHHGSCSVCKSAGHHSSCRPWFCIFNASQILWSSSIRFLTSTGTGKPVVTAASEDIRYLESVGSTYQFVASASSLNFAGRFVVNYRNHIIINHSVKFTIAFNRGITKRITTWTHYAIPTARHIRHTYYSEYLPNNRQRMQAPICSIKSKYLPSTYIHVMYPLLAR